MTVPAWAPGVIKNPGVIVRPNEVGSVTSPVLTNADFESGSSDWTFGSLFTIGTGSAFEGTNSLNATSASGPTFGAATNADRIPCDVGQKIYAECVSRHDSDVLQLSLDILFFDSGGLPTGGGAGETEWGLDDGTDDYVWRSFSVSKVVPEDAETFSVAVEVIVGATGSPIEANFDNFVISHAQLDPLAAFNFKAVQASSGVTGESEPSWPTVLGGTVVDNEVTWEAVNANTVVWRATPIYKTGSVEPTWPAAQDAVVNDNSIQWVAEPLRVTDPNCPHTKTVAIAASKVFAGDDDIIPYSATVNPLDWTSADDAGYIPFGLNTYGSQPVSALGLYRSNLVAFNSKAFQMWQVDEDPQNFAILDAVPIGCPYPHGGSPVNNDFVFPTEVGVRSMGIAGASTNLEAGVFGKQIDPLVKAELAALTSNDDVISLYYPGAGQYWLIFDDEAFVLTINGGKQDMSWSRYTFPSAIDSWTIQDKDLYLRSGDKVWRFDEDELLDDAGGADVAFEGRVWWQYLDFGAIGQDKSMVGFDTVADGEYAVSFGYDQGNDAVATTPYTITDGDTIVGDIVPFELVAPSIQMRLTFTGNQAWEWSATTLYLQDWRKA